MLFLFDRGFFFASSTGLDRRCLCDQLCRLHVRQSGGQKVKNKKVVDCRLCRCVRELFSTRNVRKDGVVFPQGVAVQDVSWRSRADRGALYQGLSHCFFAAFCSSARTDTSSNSRSLVAFVARALSLALNLSISVYVSFVVNRCRFGLRRCARTRLNQFDLASEIRGCVLPWNRARVISTVPAAEFPTRDPLSR